MSRKKFIQSQGASCRNWNWSWSYVNHDERFVIFGAWDKHSSNDRCKILALNWERNHKGHRQAGFSQALEHIDLIQQENYDLYTFAMEMSEDNRDINGVGPAKIKSFTRMLVKASLVHKDSSYFAVYNEEDNYSSNDLNIEKEYWEGSRFNVQVNQYERCPEARQACLNHHGYSCKTCGFDFEKVYGGAGKKYIHVHHITPIHKKGGKKYKLNPIKDLIPLCANCHAIIHRGRNTLLPSELKKLISSQKKRR